MYQYNNEGYHDNPPGLENSHVYQRPYRVGENKEGRSMEADDYYPTRDTDHYPQHFQNYRGKQGAVGIQGHEPSHVEHVGGYPMFDSQVSEVTDEETDDVESDSIPQRDTGFSQQKFAPKPAPKPTSYFQAQLDNSNRRRIFSRQDSSEYPQSIGDSLDHMKADRDLSPSGKEPNRPPPPSINNLHSPRPYIKSSQSTYDSNKSGQSSGDMFDRSQSAFSNSSRVDLDKSTLDRSTLSMRDTLDQNKSPYSSKPPVSSILARNGNYNSANGTLNQSTTSIRDKRNMIVSPGHGVYRVNSRNNIVSSRSPYGDANRSILSNHSVQSNNNKEQNRSIISHNYSIDQTKTPTYMQNGAAHPVKETPLDATFRSNANLSRAQSLNLSKTNLFNQNKVINAIDSPAGENFGVLHSLISLALVSLVSLVLVILGTQLIYRLDHWEFSEARKYLSSKNLLGNDSHESVLEVAVAVCSFVVMLDVSCLMVCSVQSYFAVKLLRCSQGQERCYKYLKGCAGTRFIAVTGFFISMPAFLLALLLYMLMEFRATPAIISAVVITIGLIFIICTVVHSTFYWRHEKSKADQDIPPYEGKKWLNGESVKSQSELSTLV